MVRRTIRTLLIVWGILLCCSACEKSPPQTPSFVDDRAGLLSTGERERIEAYHRRLLEDLDIHLQVTILDQSATDIDGLAVQLFEEYGLGKQTRAARGVLLLLDPKGRQVRLEVGYDLEGIFTDLLVSRVEREQMVPFFQAGRVGPGLEATVELLVDAALRQPEAAAAGQTELAHLSGGGGARTGVAIGSGAPAKDPAANPGRFIPGADPLDTLRAYREVLQGRIKDPDLMIYTPESRKFFRNWLVTDAQQANELNSLNQVLSDGEVRSRANYAVVRSDPGARTRAPYLLQRAEQGWQIDFATMSRVIGFNHRNQWHFRTLDHPYMFAFADWTFDRNGFPSE